MKFDATQLNQLLQMLVDGIKSTSSFVKEQTPDILRQIILYESTRHLIYGILFFILTLLMIWSSVNWYRKCKKCTHLSDNEGLVFMEVISLAGLAGSLVGLICNVMFFLQWVIAPKMALIGFLSDLINPGSGCK